MSNRQMNQTKAGVLNLTESGAQGMNVFDLKAGSITVMQAFHLSMNHLGCVQCPKIGQTCENTNLLQAQFPSQMQTCVVWLMALSIHTFEPVHKIHDYPIISSSGMQAVR